MNFAEIKKKIKISKNRQNLNQVCSEVTAYFSIGSELRMTADPKKLKMSSRPGRVKMSSFLISILIIMIFHQISENSKFSKSVKIPLKISRKSSNFDVFFRFSKFFEISIFFCDQIIKIFGRARDLKIPRFFRFSDFLEISIFLWPNHHDFSQNLKISKFSFSAPISAQKVIFLGSVPGCWKKHKKIVVPSVFLRFCGFLESGKIVTKTSGFLIKFCGNFQEFCCSEIRRNFAFEQK